MLHLIDYSEKAFAVTGDTKPVKDKLKALGGKFNPKLKCGAGWIFSKKKLAAVRGEFGELYYEALAPLASMTEADIIDPETKFYNNHATYLERDSDNGEDY